jgi:hypothetical protein
MSNVSTQLIFAILGLIHITIFVFKGKILTLLHNSADYTNRMNKFNKCLSDFLDILKQNYPAQKESIERQYNDLREHSDDESKQSSFVCGDRYLNEFLTNCKDKGNDLSTKNDIIFSRNSTILSGVDLYSIWNDEDGLSDSQRDNIWKYLQTLYLYAFEHRANKDFKSLAHDIKKMAKKGKNMSEEERTFLDIIDGISREKKIEKELGSEGNAEDGDDESGGAFGDIGEDMKELFETIGSQIFDGQIGTLAKEIMEELDLEKLKINDPLGFVKNIISGNTKGFDDNPEFSSIVTNIVNKLKGKLESGAIDKDKLIAETQAVFEKFQQMGFDDSDSEDEGAKSTSSDKKKKKKKKKKNPLMNMMANMMKQAGNMNMNEKDLQDLANPEALADVMKQMGSMGSDTDMGMIANMVKKMGGAGGLENMAKNMGLGSGGRMMNRMNQRERLKKKLADKKGGGK